MNWKRSRPFLGAGLGAAAGFLANRWVACNGGG